MRRGIYISKLEYSLFVSKWHNDEGQPMTEYNVILNMPGWGSCPTQYIYTTEYYPDGTLYDPFCTVMFMITAHVRWMRSDRSRGYYDCIYWPDKGTTHDGWRAVPLAAS
jgi:hypothetical protein